MKYTARHIRQFLEQGKIDPTLWKNHFPSLLPTQVPACADCEDFKARTCKGEREPVECFLEAKPVPETAGAGEDKEAGTRGKWKGKDPMLGLGARKQSIPGGANKSHDQSKM